MGEMLVSCDHLTRVTEEPLAVADLAARLTGADNPFVVRGLAANWPMVQAAKLGDDAVQNYLLQHQRDRSFPVNIGQNAGDQRLFYDAEMAMNFRQIQSRLEPLFAEMARAHNDPGAPLIYLSSIDLEDYFIDLAEANYLPIGDRRPIASIWIGTPTVIAAHNDVPDNLAICVAGRRRFTLFPPGQFTNLYLGPLDNTPAGRPVSMVDVRAPDYNQFPRFRDALSFAQVAELEPGDALFIPSLWWHHVEGLAPFNILVNYWWRDAPHFLGQPEDALLHAILALRDLPPADKRRWRALFEHYVFSNGAEVTDHLPMDARGILAPLNANSAGRLRARLLRSLAR